jgi:HEAT repeat protein
VYAIALLLSMGCGAPSQCWAQSGHQESVTASAVALNMRDLSDKSARTRESAALNLYNLAADAEAAAPAMIAMLATERDRDVRKMLVQAIGRTGAHAPEAVPTLIQILQDDRSDEMRQAAVASLGRLGLQPDLSVPALLLALRDSSDAVRSEADDALGSTGFAAKAGLIVPALAARLAAGSQGHFEFNAARALVGFGPAAAPALPQMRGLLADADAAKRKAAASVLWAIGRAASPAAKEIVATLRDADIEVRVEAAVALLAIGEHDAAAMAVLVDALVFDDGLSRRESQRNEVIPHAAWAIGHYAYAAPPSSVGRLAALAADRDEDIRRFAAVAYHKVLAALVAGHRTDAIAPLKAAAPIVSQNADGTTRSAELADAIETLKAESGPLSGFGWSAGSIATLSVVFAGAAWWARRRAVLGHRRTRRVLLSYRRDDCAASCGRIYDRLVARFGAANVFRDVDSLAPGDEFVARIRDFIGRCDVVIVLIGLRWDSIADLAGQRRLDDPADFVRMEIAEAERQSKRVVPALLDGAGMPKPQQLPADIAYLAQRNAIEITDRHFDADIDKLLNALA